jgi:hypothetical protein
MHLGLVKRCLRKKTKQRIKKTLEHYGINYHDLVRVVMYEGCKKFLKSINPGDKSALEISGAD